MPKTALDLSLARTKHSSTPDDVGLVDANLGHFVGLFRGGTVGLYRQRGTGAQPNTTVILQSRSASAALRAEVNRFHTPIALETAAFHQLSSSRFYDAPRQYDFDVNDLGVQCAADKPGPHIPANGLCLWADDDSFGIIRQYDLADVSSNTFTPSQVDHLAHTAEALRENSEH
jgi:hypothetical protein